MSRKKAKLQSKSELDFQEEALMSRVEEFSLHHNDVRKETTDLQCSLGELLNKYISREESFHNTVKDFQAHCSLRSQKMLENANEVRAAAAAEAAALQAEANKEIATWKAEKRRLSVIKTFESKMKLDVGGNRFTTSLTTLRRFPDTMIGAMFSGRHAFNLDDEGYYFIDRDGTHFRYILNFLRSPETFVCELTGAALKELKSECDYYGILEIMFPFVPIPHFVCHNAYVYSQPVTVSQNSDGIWIVNKKPMKICMHCFRADYSHCEVGHTPGYMYLSNFEKTVQAKGGSIDWSSQPKPAPTCGGCKRAQV